MIVLELGIVTDTTILADPIVVLESVNWLVLAYSVAVSVSLIVVIPLFVVVVDVVVPVVDTAVVSGLLLLETGGVDVFDSSSLVVAVALDWVVLVWLVIEVDVVLKSEQ